MFSADLVRSSPEHFSWANYGIFSIFGNFNFWVTIPKMEGQNFHKWKVCIVFPKMGTPYPKMQMPQTIYICIRQE